MGKQKSDRQLLTSRAPCSYLPFFSVPWPPENAPSPPCKKQPAFKNSFTLLLGRSQGSTVLPLTPFAVQPVSTCCSDQARVAERDQWVAVAPVLRSSGEVQKQGHSASNRSCSLKPTQQFLSLCFQDAQSGLTCIQVGEKTTLKQKVREIFTHVMNYE